MKKILTLLLFSSVLFGCASTNELTREDVIQRYDTVGTLETRLKKAEENGLDLLAPGDYEESKKLFEQAIKAGKAGDENAAVLATKGLQRLEKAEASAGMSRRIMRDALEARNRALAAEAAQFYPEKFRKLEENFKRATRQIEINDTGDAEEAQPALIRAYSDLELAALKKDALSIAKSSLARAKEADADDYAPKTFTQARDELKLSQEVLDADRSQTDKANAHAVRANTLANRSYYISELVKSFDRRDYTQEDIVLWYQKQLAQINQPYVTPLPFDQSNDTVVIELQNRSQNALAAAGNASQQLANTEQKLAHTKLARQVEQKLDRAAEQRYITVQNLFSQSEAEVYRQGNNVLLRTYALDFPVGSSEIQTKNFGLLNKIIKAIDTFDKPRVEVLGHTDSSGSTKTNQRLSQARAENVMTFLINIGNIPQDKISSQGYGESKPLVSNEDKKGRAKNRRVEILIINETPPAA